MSNFFLKYKIATTSANVIVRPRFASHWLFSMIKYDSEVATLLGVICAVEATNCERGLLNESSGDVYGKTMSGIKSSLLTSIHRDVVVKDERLFQTLMNGICNIVSFLSATVDGILGIVNGDAVKQVYDIPFQKILLYLI